MPAGRQRFTCDWIFDILVVLSDGKVVCGCADPYGERPLGQLGESDILEIWNSERVKSIREGLNGGFSPFCLNCGLKKHVGPGVAIPRRPVHLEVLPRVFLEPTVLCNLSCFKVACNRESGIVGTRTRRSFPLEEFKGLLDRIGERLIRLDLFNYGDPFVHPRAVEMVEYVKTNYPRVFLYTSTNGLMLDDEKVKRLVGAPIDEITFSVDGSDASTYERYRVGGDFNKVLGIMERMVEERNAGGREVPFINWRYILFRWNDSDRQMNKARRLAKKIGIDRLSWEITDHPAEAASHKYQIGTPHWRKVYHEIWDSSQTGNAIRRKRNLASIDVPGRRLTAVRENKAHVRVRVKNVGGARWPDRAFGWRRSVRLGAQLHDESGNLLDLNYARAFLPEPMSGGQSRVIDLELPPLRNPGRYRLKFDMVSEGIDWFESGGSKAVWVYFEVLP